MWAINSWADGLWARVQAQAWGQLRQAWTARSPEAAAPWPLNGSVERLTVCRVNRRAGAPGEAGVHPCQATTESEGRAPPAPRGGCPGPAGGRPGPGAAVSGEGAWLHPPAVSSAHSTQPLWLDVHQSETVSARLALTFPAKRRVENLQREPQGCLSAAICSPASVTVLGSRAERQHDKMSTHTEPDCVGSSPNSLIHLCMTWG